jgi:adenosylhomocysteine nucleosidase
MPNAQGRSDLDWSPMASGEGQEARLGVLCGIEREAKIMRRAAGAQGLAADVRLSGADADRAERLAGELAQSDATHLMSFGVAGALVDELRPGDLVLPDRILTAADDVIEVDPDWRSRLAADLPQADAGAILGIDRAARSIGQKVFLGGAFDAVAVDMESHWLAAAARDAGKPFVAVRVISDDRRTILPKAAIAAIGPDGRERPLRVVASLAWRPNEIKALVKLAMASNRAFRTLGGVAGVAVRLVGA